MKKTLLIVLSLALIFSLAACGGQSGSPATEQEITEQADQIMNEEGVTILVPADYILQTEADYADIKVYQCDAEDEITRDTPYVSVEILSGNTSGLSGSNGSRTADGNPYTMETLKTQMEDAVGYLTGFDPIREVTSGDHVWYMTTTMIDAVEGHIYQTVVADHVVVVKVVGPDFMDSDDAARIMESLQFDIEQ